MKLTEGQASVIRSAARFKVVVAGRGFGKTALAIEFLLYNAFIKPGARVLYISPTYQSSRDTAWTRLIARSKDAVESTNESRLEILFKNGSTAVLRGWESVETLRGQEYDAIVIDEVASLRNWTEGWEQVLRPTLRMSQGPVLFIGTPRGFNHFHELFNMHDEAWASFKFSSYDNPHLPRSEIELARRNTDETSFAQEWLAEFRKFTGLIYKEFDRQKHVFHQMPRKVFTETLLGVDFGFTNPTAILKIKKDSDSTYYIIEEVYKTEMTQDEIAEKIIQLQPNVVYADPAEPDRIAMLKKKGVRVNDVSKDVTAGITTIKQLFLQNRLFISATCTNLIQELESYRYKEKLDDRNTPEEPVKENDHALDAMRYALYMNAQTVKNYANAQQFVPSYANKRNYFLRLGNKMW